MSDGEGAPPAQDPPPTAEAAAAAPGEAASAPGEAAPAEKPKRGKPKDVNAPPKPKNGFQKCSAAARERIKAERPEIATDLAAMGAALKEEWEKVPQEEKDRLSEQYEKEMEIWRPKWAAYKQTRQYKEFFETKQDWIDGRQMKKLKKAAAKEAPARAKSGYMLFAAEVRGSVAEEVKAAGGGLSDIGKKIAELWAATSEAKKGEYDSIAAKQREKYLVEYAEYRKSDKFKKFCADKATLESKQKQKKLIRTKLDGAPKKAATSFSLWKKEAAPQFAEELKGKAMGEQAKFLGEKWAQVSDEEKAKFVAQAESLKKEYEKQKQSFKANRTYIDFLRERRQAKEREVRVVGMLNMPKRPKSVFAMFAEAHKNEVEPGKGEGKGRSALAEKFKTASEEEKLELAKKQAEAMEKFQSELTEFKASEEYKKFQNDKKKIQTEFMNEAMKVMTIKFLRHSPPAPPKTGFSVFLGEKRKAQGEADGAPSGKKEKHEEVKKYKDEFMKLDLATKKEYDNMRKEKVKAWQAEVKEYMEKPMWKEYIAEAKSLKVPIRSLLAQKSKTMKKLKNGMRFIPNPERPPDMPVKPKQAYSLFVAEKKGTMELSEIAEAWGKLEGAERKKYDDKAEELQKEYEASMRVFMESDEGKVYMKECNLTKRRKRMNLAKFQYLGKMPKKPADPKMRWMKANTPAVKRDFPDLSAADLHAKLLERFRALSEEEKEKIEQERKAQAEAFEQSMREFKAGEDWHKYCRAIKAQPKSKGKGKAKAAAPAIPVPEDMPKRPRNALQVFRSELTGKSLSEALKMYNELSQEEKDRRNREAKEAYDSRVHC
ncbi:unnamed protein product [Prorocentrum cordatum]|uniref:HMG box domain-containing protein n=1 Tax=Prorocentrum cordatum TaxID=2364126 RepID=A0ABN9X1D3_9DINO|nr:unnamed protein product [Polarella glacialis]